MAATWASAPTGDVKGKCPRWRDKEGRMCVLSYLLNALKYNRPTGSETKETVEVCGYSERVYV